MTTRLPFPCLVLALVLAFGSQACTPGRKAGNNSKPGPEQVLSSPAGDFSLRPPAGMRRLGHDSVPWAMAIPQGRDNGVVVYFFAQGASIALASPHLRVEYISRDIPGAGSTDELFDWLKGLFVNGDYGGTVVSDDKTITTADGKEVPYLEIGVPSSPDPERPDLTRSAKSMIWAYIPMGEKYFVGVNGTAIDASRYQELKKAFVTTVKSFRSGE